MHADLIRKKIEEVRDNYAYTKKIDLGVFVKKQFRLLNKKRLKIPITLYHL